MNARGLIAVGVLAAWGAGIALFVQREMSTSPRQQLTEAAMRVSPGATYFAVEVGPGRGGGAGAEHVGFASNTIDTIPGGLQVTDYFVADVNSGGQWRRANAQSVVRLSRAMGLRDFSLAFGIDSDMTTASGRMVRDSLLEYIVRRPGGRPDTTRVSAVGPMLLPTLVPLAVALGKRPEVGRLYTFEAFDPSVLATRSLRLRVQAESMFVLIDSAAFDRGTARWLGAHADTVRAWHLASDGDRSFDAWVDELGRIVSVRARVLAGYAMHRTAYEMAFENWRTASPLRRSTSGAADEYRARTAVSARVSPGDRRLDTLRVRLSGIDLSRLALHGGSQTRAGDTVTIARDTPLMLRPAFPLPPSDATRQRFSRELRAEPLLEVDDPEIMQTARLLKGRDADPRVVAERMAQWVYSTLAKEPSVGLPSAAATLRSRAGDCGEHTQLFVALARAAGIPARAITGYLDVNGTMYYHTWAEVLLQRWIPVDPTFGQFPADAAHLRLLVGGLALQTDAARVVARVHVEIMHQTRASDKR